VIRLRAHLLLITLPYSVEGLRPQLDALVAILPQGSRRVLYLDRLLGFLVPHTAIADIQAVRWRNVLNAFSRWWIIGLNGELVCKDKSEDPFRTWMNEYRETGSVSKMLQSENLFLSEGRQPGIEPSVHDLIERTFGKMGTKPPTEGEGS
jgi:hypothetical protein